MALTTPFWREPRSLDVSFWGATAPGLEYPANSRFCSGTVVGSPDPTASTACLLTPGVTSVTYSLMRTISLKELHQHTGKHARRAAKEPVLVTDRGNPIAVLGPPLLASSQQPLARSFAIGDTVKAKGKTESSKTVSLVRDER